MHYDPIKQRLAVWLGSDSIRRLFHIALDVLFLRAWFVHRELRCILKSDFTDSIRSGNPRFLDAGMGFGQYSDWVLRKNSCAHIIGLEIDRQHLYSCEEFFSRQHRSRLRFMLGDVQILPFKNDCFDLIWAIDVMEHIPNDSATFCEFARIMKPGGKFLMHTPRQKPGESIISSKKNGWTVGEHERDGYSDDDAQQKLVAAGLDVVKIVRGYALPGKIGWTLLQRIPLSMLAFSRWLIPIVGVYFFVALPLALPMMALDYIRGDHPDGGSLLVVAQKK